MKCGSLQKQAYLPETGFADLVGKFDRMLAGLTKWQVYQCVIGLCPELDRQSASRGIGTYL